jgi:hypothetical protein
MEVFILIITILSVIGTWVLISSGFRLARRIAVATESTAAGFQALYDALPPEARAQAAEAAARRKKVEQDARPLNQIHRALSQREDRWNRLKAKPREV